VDPVVSPETRAAFDRERGAARAARPRDEAAMRELTQKMYARLEAFQAKVIAENDVKVACRRGCSYCCHLRVEMRPHEAFVLAHHIATRVDPAMRDRLIARLEATATRLATMSVEEHRRAVIPCALLEDGACAVYEARPAACRKYYSVSVDTCRDAYDNIAAPLSGPLEDDNVRLAGNAIALGYTKGREEAGMDTKLYELHFALRRALQDNVALRRYRAGKQAFV